MKISVSELKKSMVVDEDIFSQKGALLLYKGFSIENPELVAIVLQRNGIEEINIKDEKTVQQISAVKVSESSEIRHKIENEVKAFKEEFSEVLSGLKDNIEVFKEDMDIAKIKGIDKGLELAREYEKSVLTIFQLVENIKNENQDEYSNMIQTSMLSYSIGKWLDLDEKTLKEICEASIIGSIIDYANTDRKIIDQSDLKGKNTVSEDVLKAALAINERTDGSGPLGLKGEEIHPYSRIIAVADVYQSLTNGSEIMQKLSVFDAIRIMEREYLTKLDVKTLYVFLHRIGSKFIGSNVKLNEGTVGEIVFVPENEVSMPYIKLEDGHVINLQSDEYKSRHIVEIF